MEIVIELPEPDHLTYAWWWAEPGGTTVEQSKADVFQVAAVAAGESWVIDGNDRPVVVDGLARP